MSVVKTGGFTLALAVIGFCSVAPSVASAQTCREWFAGGAPRWQEPQETAMALFEPHCYSWRLFIALNWPADLATKKPNQQSAFGADGPVVWESWRNASRNAADTAFPDDGSDPGEWLSVPPTSIVAMPFSAEDSLPLQQRERIRAMGGPDVAIPTFDPDSAQFRINETRLNKETFEFVRQNELYNLQGQQKLFLDGAKNIAFPLNAKEVKAQWRKIDEADKPRYHWAEHKVGNTVTIFGLTALHITTKDLPNWLWTTFEHIDNREPGVRGNEGWKLPSVDEFACPVAPYNCENPPTGIGLESTKWENYRLRGAQTDFVDSTGAVTRLANSQPEEGFQETSSCITCHSRSSINGEGKRLPIFEPNGTGSVGSPNPGNFTDTTTGARRFTQLDFVWSLFRASPKQ